LNVLLVQLKRIGDLILTVPAVAAVRRNFPEARITLLVAHGSRELLPAIPGVDRVLVARGGAADFARWCAVAAADFDYCLDFSRTDRSAFLTWLSGARERITYDTARREPIRQLCYNQFIPSRVGSVHTVDHHLMLLAPLGVHDALLEIHLVLPRSAETRADEIVKQQIGEDFIILHSGSARAEKFWVPERWAKIVSRLSKAHAAGFVLTGGRSGLERKHVVEIKSQLDQPIVDLSGTLDLLTLAALIRRARLLVTIDSAPMHLAAAFGTPQVALFGPTNPFHWRPRTTPALILQGNASAPLRVFDPQLPPAAMNQISTESVIDAMQSLLSQPAASVS
jgi:predicted lipopolysaccharide heptosyltransferase III